MKGSLYFVKQYDFVIKLSEIRRKKLLKRAFFVSFLLHFLFFALFISLSFVNKNHYKPQIIEVLPADYKPFPTEEKVPEAVPEKTQEKETIENREPVTPIEKEKVIATKEAKETKQESSFKIPVNTKPDLSWRKNVDKIVSKEKLKKITVSKLDNLSKGEDNKKAPHITSTNVPLVYARMLSYLIRSHWSIPEDLGHKFYGLSAEIEVTIDTMGNIKSSTISRSSGDPIFDDYAKDAVAKTGKIPLPPKEVFTSIFLNDKIIIEFRP